MKIFMTAVSIFFSLTAYAVGPRLSGTYLGGLPYSWSVNDNGAEASFATKCTVIISETQHLFSGRTVRFQILDYRNTIIGQPAPNPPDQAVTVESLAIDEEKLIHEIDQNKAFSITGPASTGWKGSTQSLTINETIGKTGQKIWTIGVHHYIVDLWASSDDATCQILIEHPNTQISYDLSNPHAAPAAALLGARSNPHSGMIQDQTPLGKAKAGTTPVAAVPGEQESRKLK